jgi:type II secretory pathway pseudopilin PulG
MNPCTPLLCTDHRLKRPVTDQNKRSQRVVYRLAFSLLEVIIASSILFALIAALLSAWSATIDFTYMENQNLKRMETVDRVQTTLYADFQKVANFETYDPTTKRTLVGGLRFPAIGLGGRELRFIRLRDSTSPMSNPESESNFTTRFTTTDGTRLSQFASSNVSPYFILNPDGIAEFSKWNMSPVWETNLRPASGGLTFAQNSDSDNLRIYRYILVPYSNIVPMTISDDSVGYITADYPPYDVTVDFLLRRGMLLRQYLNASDASDPTPVWRTIGIPLSDSVVFHGDNLDPNLCFVFSSPSDREVQLKLTLGFNADKNASHMVQIDLRLSLPFRSAYYGQ